MHGTKAPKASPIHCNRMMKYNVICLLFSLWFPIKCSHIVKKRLNNDNLGAGVFNDTKAGPIINTGEI
jgi:hypothetical protein